MPHHPHPRYGQNGCTQDSIGSSSGSMDQTSLGSSAGPRTGEHDLRQGLALPVPAVAARRLGRAQPEPDRALAHGQLDGTGHGEHAAAVPLPVSVRGPDHPPAVTVLTNALI